MQKLKVKVKFNSTTRKSFPCLYYAYRPHFVVDGDSEILGVEFLESDLNEFDVFGEAIVKLLYDGVGYRKLQKGVKFKIVEGGATVVGEGYVLA